MSTSKFALTFKKFKKVFLYLLILLPIYYALTVKVVVSINSNLPIFSKLSGYTLYQLITGDNIVTLANIPILLFIISMIGTRGGYFERIRFNRRDLLFYNLFQCLIICILIAFLEVFFISLFCRLVMPVKVFEWANPMVLIVLFEDVTKEPLLPYINGSSFLIASFLIILIRNISISLISISLSIFLNKNLSMGIAMGIFLILNNIPFIGRLYAFEFRDLILGSALVLKFGIILVIMLICLGIYYYLQLNKEEIR